jgi:DNA (cytosine-5)-methyltransferase 1
MTEIIKPPYAVPSMDSIRAMPWNGFNAISTFSGCGGSSTGYRMAGFKVLWASEFIDAARESYAANKAPYTILDGRDIRQVKPEDILKAINMKPGELDLFDGSPPCASFSTAGKREAGWGKVKKYSDKSQRTDDLFFEFSRLVRGVQPKVFVAENVSGLVKGTAKGYFLEILADLKAAGYRVKCKVLDAQWLGVPQARQRTIFIGVREDLEIEPVHPKPMSYRYSVRDAIPWITKVIQDPKGQFAIQEAGDTPCFTIKAGSSVHCTVQVGDPKHNKKEGSGWSRGEKHSIDKPALSVMAGGYGGANADDVLINLTGCDEQIAKIRIADGFDGEKWVDAGSRPYSTVGASSASGCNLNSNGGKAEFIKSSGEVIRRKFTIAELKRLCAFPDDFILKGTYAQQWERLGRAVPPVMMKAVAETIRDQILSRIK